MLRLQQAEELCGVHMAVAAATLHVDLKNPCGGGRAARAARNPLRHNANRARPSTGKHTPRLGHTVPRARERGWPLALEESFRDPLQDHARIIPRPRGRRDCNQSSRAACRSIRAPWASGWRAGDAALSAQRRVPDGVRPRVTREVRSGCVAVSLAECLVLWFCVSLLCDRHRPSCVHPYRVGVPVVGRTVFRLPINQSIRVDGKLSLAEMTGTATSDPAILFFVLPASTPALPPGDAAPPPDDG